MACFIFDGVDYSDILEVASVEMPAIPASTPDLRYATGKDGAYFAGNQLNPLTLKIRARIATRRIDPRDIQRIWSIAAASMRTDEPRPLSLAEGIYRMAVLVEESPLEFMNYSATAELTFLCPDPVAYGEERTVTIPSGSSATIVVGGTYPARPVIAASAGRDSGALVWGIRLDGEDFVHVDTGSASATAVEIDCARRTCRVGTEAAMITLDSDWLALAPGEHTLTMDKGTGDATVRFAERWL